MAEAHIGIRVKPDTTRFRADLKKVLERAERTLSVDIRANLDPARKALGKFVRELSGKSITLPATISDRTVKESAEKARKTTEKAGKRDPIELPAEFDDDYLRQSLQQARRAAKRVTLDIPATVEGERLRQSLKSAVEDLERQTRDVKIPVDAEAAAAFRQNIQAMVKHVEDQAAQIKVDADTAKAAEDLDELAEDREATINAEADTAAASARLRIFTRPRWVQIKARLDESSLMKVGTALAALSGARLVNDYIKNLRTSLSNLDRSLPRIAAVSLGVATIGAAALSSVQGVFSLGAALSSVAGSFLVLPALASGFAVSIGSLIAVLKDAGQELGDLGPAFSRLQDSMSTAYWDRARGPIKEMVTSLLPGMTRGLTAVSSELGGFTAELAKQLRVGLRSEALNEMFAGLARSIDIAKGALRPLVQAFTTLGTVGARYLPRLAGWFVDVSDAFNHWVQVNNANGNMLRWIETGIENLKNLGVVLRETGSILSGIATAANKAGSGNGLEALATNLTKIADIVNREPFQGALVTVFEGAGNAMRSLGDALGPVGDAFVSLAPTIKRVLTAAGETVGTFLADLAGALENPVFQDGLTALFDGLQEGLAAVGPALPSLAEAFGSVATVAGTLAASLGPVLGAAVQALAPVLVELLGAVEPLIPILGDALVQAITALAPLLGEMAGMWSQILAQVIPVAGEVLAALLPALTALAPPLMELAQALLPPVLSIIQALSPVIIFLAEALAWVLQAVAPLVPALGLLASSMNPLFTLGAALAIDWQAMGQAVEAAVQSMVSSVIGWFQDLQARATGAVSGLVSSVTGWWQNLKSQTAGAVQAMVSSVTGRFTSIQSTMTSKARSAVSAVTGAWSNARSATASAFGQIASTVSNQIGRAVSAVTSIRGKVTSALSGAGQWLVSAGRNMVQGMIRGLQSAMGNLMARAREMARNAVNAVKTALGIHSPSRVFRDEVGKMIPAGVVEGMDAGRPRVQRAAESLVDIPTVPGPQPGTGGHRGRADGNGRGGTQVNVYTSDPREAAYQTVRILNRGAV